MLNLISMLVTMTHALRYEVTSIYCEDMMNTSMDISLAAFLNQI